MAMSEQERNKKARMALFVMVGVEIAAFIAFWFVQSAWHDANLAFALLIMGVLFGAGYYIYEVRKLRAKD